MTFYLIAIIKSSRRLFFRRPGILRQTVQTTANQTGIHPSRRGTGLRHPLRQRLLPDHHLQVRGPPVELQEHVQADAAAEEVAGGGGLDHGHLGLHRQDRRAGQEAEEADLHRGIDKGGAGAAL